MIWNIRSILKKRSRMVSNDKYSTDPDHREKVKKMNVDKYKSNESYRENIKRRRQERYATDTQHRDAVKTRSIQKYNTNAEHRNILKRKRKKNYESDEKFRESKLHAAAKRYKSDKSFRSKTKAYNRNQYNCSATKIQKKEMNKKRRLAKKVELEHQDEVVRVFKEKAKQGIDYSCCCCNRLLFQNQVLRCERHTYAKNEQANTVAEMCIQTKY